MELNGVRMEGELSLRIVNHGLWEIDKTTGKHLLLVELTIPSKELSLNFPPSDMFFIECIDRFLESERANDDFTFHNPVLNAKRPPQLSLKREKFQDIIDRYRPPNRLLAQFMPSIGSIDIVKIGRRTEQ